MSQLWSPKTNFLVKGTKMILGLGQEMYVIIVGHLAKSESKKAIRDHGGYVKRTQEPTRCLPLDNDGTP